MDSRTNKLVSRHRPVYDPWMVNPADRDYLLPHERWCIRCGESAAAEVHRVYRWRVTYRTGDGLLRQAGTTGPREVEQLRQLMRAAGLELVTAERAA